MTPKKFYKQPLDKNNLPECNTDVYIGIGEPRQPCSFRANKKLFKAFVKQLKLDSLSSCHILEPVMLAYLTNHVYISDERHTHQQNIDVKTPPLVIENFNVARVVQRLRRVGVPLDVVEVTTEKKTETVTKTVKKTKFVDYSQYSLEELQEAYDNSVDGSRHTQRMMVRAEFNKRGIVPEVSK